jgi:prolyl oligopeptidase
VIANDGPVFYVQTDRDAPRGRIVAVDVSKPGPADPKNWREVIPQSELPIDGVSVVADRLIVQYKQDASDIVKLYQLDGTFVRDIPLPTVGVVGFSAAQRKDKQVFFTFTSFTYPPTIYRLNFEADPKGEVTLHRQAQVKFNPDDYESTRVFATSKDGTRVPLFVVHKKGLKLDGTAPAILYGYGGFNISMGPGFNPLTIAWLEQGGVYAMACLRGGNEYGEDWHQAGMLGRKQNVFDDLYACSKKLVAAGYTSHRKLAIEGGSNGGLLTAAAVVQKPDLFGAVVSHVPVIDMYRYHKMGIGRFWVPEYGSAEKSEDFQWLSAYSPLHNVKPNVDYPPILVTTAEGDDRVVPAHAFKFAATMITTSTSRNPLFLRTETKAGHGGGKPVSKVMDEVADKYAFLAKVFGMGWK